MKLDYLHKLKSKFKVYQEDSYNTIKFSLTDFELLGIKFEKKLVTDELGLFLNNGDIK